MRRWRMALTSLSIPVLAVVVALTTSHSASVEEGEADAVFSAAVRSCKEGDLTSCLEAADEYSLSLDRADVRRAVTLYERACEAGMATACQAAGAILASDRLGAADPAQAALRFQRARDSYSAQCQDGTIAACADLVEMAMANQIAVASEDVAAWDTTVRREYGAECERGTASTCLALGDYCGRRDDNECFVFAHQEACGVGHAGACCLIGRVFREGAHGTTADAVEATRYLDQACDGGYVRCCGDAAAQHRAGSGTKKDLEKAVALFTHGCDAGLAEDCRDLALMYEAGEGVPADAARARELLEKACTAGLQDACRH